MSNSCSRHFPFGIYVNRTNKYDTIRLYPDGNFEQIIYNRQKNLFTIVSLNGNKH